MKTKSIFLIRKVQGELCVYIFFALHKKTNACGDRNTDTSPNMEYYGLVSVDTSNSKTYSSNLVLELYPRLKMRKREFRRLPSWPQAIGKWTCTQISGTEGDLSSRSHSSKKSFSTKSLTLRCKLGKNSLVRVACMAGNPEQENWLQQFSYLDLTRCNYHKAISHLPAKYVVMYSLLPLRYGCSSCSFSYSYSFLSKFSSAPLHAIPQAPTSICSILKNTHISTTSDQIFMISLSCIKATLSKHENVAPVAGNPSPTQEACLYYLHDNKASKCWQNHALQLNLVAIIDPAG